MMKSNLNFKKIVSRRNNDRWHINISKENKANDKFKEFTNNININVRININKRWDIIRSTVTEVASKTLKENNMIVPGKEWITTEIASMIEERRKLRNGTTLEIQRKYRELRNLVIRKSKEARKNLLKKNAKK